MGINSIFDDIGRALKFLAECFKMIVEDPKLLVPSLLAVIFGFIMSLVLIVPLAMMYFAGALAGKLGYALFGGIVLVFLFISYAFNYFFIGATSYAVYQHVKFGKSSLGEAFSRALSCITTLLLLAATAAVLKMIVDMLKNNNGRRGFILSAIANLAGDLIREGWTIAISLLVPVAVISRLGFVDTLKKSFEIVKNNLVVIGAGEAGIRILGGIIGFVGTVFAFLLAGGLFYTLTFVNFIMAIAVALPVLFVCLSFISMINLFIRTSYYTMVYIWAEENLVHGQEGPIAAPAPILNSFGART